MNETIKEGTSAFENQITSPVEVMKLLSDHMLKTRSRGEVKRIPYLQQPGYRMEGAFGPAVIDLNAEYPKARIGETAYAVSIVQSEREEEAVINLLGNAKVWLNGQEVYQEETGETGWHMVPVTLKKENILLIRCKKTKENWGCKFYISCARYPFMWARDYLLHVKCTIPFAGKLGMEGFAFLGVFEKEKVPSEKLVLECLERGESFSLEGKDYDWLPKLWEKEERVDISGMYPREGSFCVYAYTECEMEAQKEYVLSLKGDCEFKAFVDGEELPFVEGWKKALKTEESGDEEVKRREACIKGTGTRCQILVKAVFSGSTEDGTALKHWMQGKLYAKEEPAIELQVISFLDKGSKERVEWLYAGPFCLKEELPEERLLDTVFAPERALSWNRPFALGGFNKGFWRASKKDAFLRLYRDTSFFGQWFYAIQVGLQGLFVAARVLGEEEKQRYFLDSVEEMAEYYEYSLWDQESFGCPSMLPRACSLTELDPCGTIGVSMVEAYLHGNSEKALEMVKHLGNIVMEKLLTFEDGAYYRGKTMWADDFYMSCPFLIRLWALFKEEKYRERVMEQVRGFTKRLYMPEKKLFSHIYFVEEKTDNKIPWGRGNGWIALALTEILPYLEGEDKEMVLALYRDFMEGVQRVQDEDGMWHQVLDLPSSYEETSCTGMFLVSMLRGLRYGWLFGEKYEISTRRAWRALLKKGIDKEGTAYGVCMGSGCAMDASYYCEIPVHKDDDHGTGILMMAAAEIWQNDTAHISGYRKMT